MSKPDWKDAPEWANWLALDDGGWFWSDDEPFVFDEGAGDFDWASLCKSEWCQNYTTCSPDGFTPGEHTKERRPMNNESWSEWIEWKGGECPLPKGTICDVRLRRGDVLVGVKANIATGGSPSAHQAYWDKDNLGSDIIAYRYKLQKETLTPEQEVDAHKEQGLMTLESTDEEEEAWQAMEEKQRHTSDGSTASYYELPPGCTELQHLISYRNLNAQDGEIFRAIYRKGLASHSDALRDARKVLFYAKAEVERLEKYCIG